METALESEPEWGTVLVCGGIRRYVLRDAESQQELALNAAEVLERFQAYRARHQPTGPDEHRLLNQSDREESGSESTSLRNVSRGDRIRTCDIQLPKLAL
jgi:xanthine/CO dehydrogenase XdhC/CoxF family maturation factor